MNSPETCALRTVRNRRSCLFEPATLLLALVYNINDDKIQDKSQVLLERRKISGVQYMRRSVPRQASAVNTLPLL